MTVHAERLCHIPQLQSEHHEAWARHVQREPWLRDELLISLRAVVPEMVSHESSCHRSLTLLPLGLPPGLSFWPLTCPLILSSIPFSLAHTFAAAICIFLTQGADTMSVWQLLAHCMHAEPCLQVGLQGQTEPRKVHCITCGLHAKLSVAVLEEAVEAVHCVLRTT